MVPTTVPSGDDGHEDRHVGHAGEDGGSIGDGVCEGAGSVLAAGETRSKAAARQAAIAGASSSRASRISIAGLVGIQNRGKEQDTGGGEDDVVSDQRTLIQSDGSDSPVRMAVVARIMASSAGIEIGKSTMGSISSRLRVRKLSAEKKVPFETSAQVPSGRMSRSSQVLPSGCRL